MKIEFGRREVTIFYLLIIGLDLFFILANCPLFPDLLGPTQTFAPNPLIQFVRRQLDLKTECVLATWYSSVLFFMTGVAALANIGSRNLSGWLKWSNRAGWLVLGCVIIGISADEVGQIHESLARLLNSMDMGVGYREGAGDWVPVLLPFIIGVSVIMVLFFGFTVMRCRVMVLGFIGLAFWVCAIVSESIEAGFLRVEMSYDMRGFIEEGCELIGATLLLIAFVQFYRKTAAVDERSDGVAAAVDPAIEGREASD